MNKKMEEREALRRPALQGLWRSRRRRSPRTTLRGPRSSTATSGASSPPGWIRSASCSSRFMPVSSSARSASSRKQVGQSIEKSGRGVEDAWRLDRFLQIHPRRSSKLRGIESPSDVTAQGLADPKAKDDTVIRYLIRRLLWACVLFVAGDERHVRHLLRHSRGPREALRREGGTA